MDKDVHINDVAVMNKVQCCLLDNKILNNDDLVNIILDYISYMEELGANIYITSPVDVTSLIRRYICDNRSRTLIFSGKPIYPTLVKYGGPIGPYG
jgi:hypothetical protein